MPLKYACSVARAPVPAVNRRATNRRRLQAGSYHNVRADSIAKAGLIRRLSRSTGFQPRAGRQGANQAYLSGIGQDAGAPH